MQMQNSIESILVAEYFWKTIESANFSRNISDPLNLAVLDWKN
jgi:hypothetical protein